ncbi:MAG: VOC family protein [Acidiferrobacter sp.]
MTRRPAQIVGIGLNVMDLAASTRFYREALGFVLVGNVITANTADRRRFGALFTSQRLRLGAQDIVLTAFPRSAPYPTDSNAADLWFQHMAIVTADIDGAYARLQGWGIVPISIGGPQRLPATSGGVTAFKFRDPDGHPLELIAFPPHTQTTHAVLPLTLGIDHSAISVADTERSLRFYETVLQLPTLTRQCNQGPEQARLDNLAGVVTEVTGLGAAHTPPHLELLAYRVPRGRPPISPMPFTAIAATRLIVQTDAIAPALACARELGSPAIIAETDFALLRDPDGHVLVLVATDVDVR